MWPIQPHLFSSLFHFLAGDRKLVGSVPKAGVTRDVEGDSHSAVCGVTNCLDGEVRLLSITTVAFFWGNKEDLMETTDFITRTGLTV